MEGRAAHGWSRRELARRAKVSRQLVDLVENAAITPTLDTVARLFDPLGIEAELVTRSPFLIDGGRQGDAAHSRCGAYVHRRLQAARLTVRREVEIVHGRTHGWIDLLALEPATRTAVVVEIKTQLDNLGRIERTIAWYEREAGTASRRLGWRPSRVVSWLILLATDSVDARLSENRATLALAFPARASALDAWLRDPASKQAPSRGLALVDPRNRRRTWLLRSRIDGRRSAAPYRNYADFMRASLPNSGKRDWPPMNE